MIRLRPPKFVILLCIAVAATASPAQSRRLITDTDLFKFVWAADPQISPNGTQVAFVRVNVNEDKDRYETQVFVVPSDGSAPPRPLTSGRNDRSPRWSPNGREIAFVRTPEPVDGKTKPSQIYLISMDGGEARALTDAPKGASSPVWSPDGRTIAFLSVPDTARADSTKKSADTTRRHISDVRVITRAQYRWNGAGFTDVESAKPSRFYNEEDLYVIDANGSAKPRNLTASYDYDVEGGLTADQHPPRAGAGGGVIWSKDGRSVIVVTTENGRANLKRFSIADGKVDSVTAGNQDVVSYTASADGSRIVTLVSTPVNIGDLFVIDAKAPRAAPRQITRVNEGLFSTLDLTAPEEFSYNSFDGKRIQGWILKPPRFDASKKYPLILEIHGGPNAAYGYTFTHEFDWMAAKGYVVVYVNPRGSTSYGQDFANVIQYHYPGDDYRDLMLGVDEVLKRGYVDSTRMGVTGGSGGGVLTNWIVGHTHRFAAAVSQRSIADWSGFWYSADFTLFNPTWFSGAPWENTKQFAELSPITYVANVTTPLMLIEGESDMRTPPALGGEQMFRALKYLHKPTVMVRFPEETHELSRSGKPWHRVERLQHIVAWFDKYVNGQDIRGYDTK